LEPSDDDDVDAEEEEEEEELDLIRFSIIDRISFSETLSHKPSVPTTITSSFSKKKVDNIASAGVSVASW